MPNINAPIPENPNDESEVFLSFLSLVRILRQECPWDKKQTNKSIAHLTIEESYEILDAIENNDDDELSKELGDVFLHILLHSVIAEERGAFDIINVITDVHKKMIHRHPHVFGDVNVSSDEEVVQNWEKLKKSEGKTSALDGVPNGLPSLLKAQRIQHKASKVGFDWDNKEDVWSKVFEEIEEFKETLLQDNLERKSEEFGDLIFALVNVARHENIVPEEALHYTNNKFIKRFQYIESKAKEKGRSIEELTLLEMDALWEEAKSK